MLDDIIRAPRTDVIYNMHGYLTKVPVGAIIPFINEYTPEEGVVVDMFAGSGMTALAAKMTNRKAVVSDISKLGQHIGTGYLARVSPSIFKSTAERIVKQSKQDIGWLYNTVKSSSGEVTESIRTIWTFVYECVQCQKPINYYKALKKGNWQISNMKCPHCKHEFIKKGARVVSEEPVFTVVKEKKQVEQPLSNLDFENLRKADVLDYQSKIPSQKITEEREMYKRSALAKWNLIETKRFFSQRNSAVLYDLWEKINKVQESNLRQKLRFCFTSILPRASRRYQWSLKVPLNAANQHYYISPVFYEWNVYDLFLRKIDAALRSDGLLFSNSINENSTQKYVTASADQLKHLKNESVDYVFTDPPFGSNIFYSDMNLFQEAWIGEVTDNTMEAVIKTTVDKAKKEKSKQFYKELLRKAFGEAYRVLKKGGIISIVFGNSKGDVWTLAQEAFIEAGFNDKPISINILDKGQRSVKGLNSGIEKVSTLDLIVTLKKPASLKKRRKPSKNLNYVMRETFDNLKSIEGYTASHIYLEVLKSAIYENVNVSMVDLKHVLEILEGRGYKPDTATGILFKSA